MINIKNLSLKFDREIFSDVTLDIQDSVMTTFDGESGCGKSTLIKMIMGDFKPDSGCILFDNDELNEKQREHYLYSHIAYVDQMASFYPNMTIKKHFLFYERLYGIDLHDFHSLLSTVHLENIDINKSPSVLSTGERKRLMLLLVVSLKKEILIVDEPTASLDAQSREIVLSLLKDYVKQGYSVITATHDADVIEMSDVVYEITDGKIEKIKDSYVIKTTPKQPKTLHSISYSRFKNIKLRIILMILLIITSISLIIPSLTLSSRLGYELKSQTTYQASDSYGLVLTKRTTDRDIDDLDAVDDRFNDFISEKEINEFMKIEGIKKISPYYSIMPTVNSATLNIYDNNQLVKKYDNKIKCQDNIEVTGQIYFISYNPSQKIKHNGKEITDGIYLDENFKKIFNDNIDIKGKVLKSKFIIPIAIKFVKNDIIYSVHRSPEDLIGTTVTYRSVPQYEEQLAEKTISFPIQDYISINEFNVLPSQQTMKTDDALCIYIPYKTMEEMFKNYNNTESRFYSRKYLIECDTDKKQDIKIAIEKMSQLYNVKDQGENLQAIKEFDYHQMDKQSVMSLVVMGALLVSSVLFSIYTILLRKNEIERLKHDGLSSQIYKYYIKDYRILLCLAVIISFIGMAMSYYQIRSIFKLMNYISVWIIVTVVLAVLLYVVDKYAIKSILIRKCHDNDYNK